MLEESLLDSDSRYSDLWFMMLNYFRGSVGFGEEALQSLPGKVGSRVLNLSFEIN